MSVKSPLHKDGHRFHSNMNICYIVKTSYLFLFYKTAIGMQTKSSFYVLYVFLDFFTPLPAPPPRKVLSILV